MDTRTRGTWRPLSAALGNGYWCETHQAFHLSRPAARSAPPQTPRVEVRQGPPGPKGDKGDPPSEEEVAAIIAAVLSRMDLRGPPGRDGARGEPGPPGTAANVEEILRRLEALENARIEFVDDSGAVTQTRSGKPNVSRFRRMPDGSIKADIRVFGVE